jgi:arginine decarboxylase-like protein
MGKTLDRRAPDAESPAAWKLHDAFETYGVKNWGKGYFSINKQLLLSFNNCYQSKYIYFCLLHLHIFLHNV